MSFDQNYTPIYAAANAAAVTPSDSKDLTATTRALLVGTAGDVKVTTLGGQTVVIAAAPAGLLPIQATRVWAGGTTATNLTALW